MALYSSSPTISTVLWWRWNLLVTASRVAVVEASHTGDAREFAPLVGNAVLKLDL